MRPERLAAGVAVALLACAAATWLRFGLEGTLRIDTATPAFLWCALLVGAGLSAAGAAALRLQTQAAAAQLPRLFRSALIAHLCAWPALALTSSDLFSNLAYGELTVRGLNPYLVGPAALGTGQLLELVTPRWVNTPSVYGPPITALDALAALCGRALGGPLWGAGAAYKLLLLGATLCTVLLAYRHALQAARDDARTASAGFVLLAFSPLLLWEGSAQAHNDGVMLCALMAFVCAARAGRETLAAVLLALGTWSKLAVAPLLALYLLFLFRRAPAKALLLAALALGLGALFLAPFWTGPEVLGGPGAALWGDVDRHAHSLADLLHLLLRPAGQAAQATAVRLCWFVSAAVVTWTFLRAAQRASDLASVLRGSLCVLLSYCLTTPWFQPWYAVWLLPLAAAERDLRWQRAVAGYTLITVVQWALPLDPFTTLVGNAWVLRELWHLRRVPVLLDEAPAAAAA